MTDAIFLSAGVPDPKQGPQYSATADTVAITAAVSALVHVTLGRRLLVWGGHPAITPMIWVVAQDISVEYGHWVRLYQSRYFEDEFPEDNARFHNATFTEDVERDRDKSLRLMRERMFSEHAFKAAVFIGGMDGIIQEYELFRELQPDAAVVPVVPTGGASLEVAARMGQLSPDLMVERDYIALFHRHLEISVREERYRSPEEQPLRVEQRFWRPAAAHFTHVAAGTGGGLMAPADDKSRRDQSDRSRVSGTEAYEVDYFAKKHGLTRQRAQDLIKKHGNNRKELDAAAERLKRGGE